MPESLAGFELPGDGEWSPRSRSRVSPRLMLEPSVPTTWINRGNVEEVWAAEVAVVVP